MAKTKTTKTKETSTKKDVEVKGKYYLEIKTNDQVFETTTDDIAEAIIAFKIPVFKTQTFIKVSNGKKTVEKYMFTAFARRLFRNQITAKIFAKNVILALGEK